ncbi:hypothetical protein C8R44DRAFT_788408 [Mycena epipterygia]|nr:hypothetical protein C8R44DRAFT_788408 [Mycena epipterygia]
MNLPDSDTFAVILGLKTSVDPNQNLPEGQEMERHHRLMSHLRMIDTQTEENQDLVWSKFCALYLPATVDRFLDPPVPTDATNANEREMMADFPLNNPWHETLVRVQHIPYFAKYLRSSSPIAAGGKRLPQVLSARLAGLAGKWDQYMTAPSSGEDKRQYYMAAAGSALQVLCTLCTHFIKTVDRSTVIPHATQQKLLPFLTAWGRRYKRQFLGDVSLRLIAYLSNVVTPEFNAIRKVNKNWDVCGLPSCSVRRELKVCANCQTVRYCSADHQRKDWAGSAGTRHKRSCHRTDY